MLQVRGFTPCFQSHLLQTTFLYWLNHKPLRKLFFDLTSSLQFTLLQWNLLWHVAFLKEHCPPLELMIAALQDGIMI